MNTQKHRELHRKAMDLLNRIEICSEEFQAESNKLKLATKFRNEKDMKFHEWNCNHYAARKMQAHTEYINVMKQLRNELLPELAQPENMVQMAEWFHQVNALPC